MIRDYQKPQSLIDTSIKGISIEMDVYRADVYPPLSDDELGIPTSVILSHVDVMPRHAHGSHSVGIYGYHSNKEVYAAEVPLDDPDCFTYIDAARERAGQRVVAAMAESPPL